MAAVTPVEESNVGEMDRVDLESGRVCGRTLTLTTTQHSTTSQSPQNKSLCSGMLLSDNSKSYRSIPNVQPGLTAAMSSHDSTIGQNSSKNSSVIFCRICHDGESGGERLISPCRCSGSVGLVHRTCIEKWLTIVNIDSCELCKQKYLISRHPRPFSSWLCEPVVGDDQRNLVGDGVCFILLTPLAVISVYLCACGAAFYFKEKKSEAIGLICLSSMLVLIYMAWLVLTIRYHCLVWFKWQTNNQDIRLLNVSGQRSGTLPAIHRHHRRMSPPLPPTPPPVVDMVDTDSDEAVVISDASFADQLVLPYIMSSPSTNLADHLDLAAAKAVIVNVGENKEPDEEQSHKTSRPPCSPPQPLSPNIISFDPQNQSHSEIVRTTDDSEIYAQISDPCSSAGKGTRNISFPLDHQLSIRDRAVTVPYLPDLKDHFMALRSKQVNRTVESRGTFSPNQRSRTVTFTVTQVRDSDISDPAVPQYEVAGSALQHAVVTSDVPLHAEAISVRDPKHPADSSDIPQQTVVSCQRMFQEP